MDVSAITTMIANVGFPIAMCLIIMYYWNNQFTKEMDKLSDIISQLNLAVNKILTEFDNNGVTANDKE